MTDRLPTGLPVPDINPPAESGISELDIDEAYHFVLDNGITNLKNLLSVLQYHMQNHYGFIEVTRALNTATPEQPGIMLYRVAEIFILNINVN